MIGEEFKESCVTQPAAPAAPVPAAPEVLLGQGPTSGPTQLLSYILCSSLQPSGWCSFPKLPPLFLNAPFVWASPGAALGKEPWNAEVLGRAWRLCSSRLKLSAKPILNSELLISWQSEYLLCEQEGGWMNAFLQENVTALGTGTSEPSLSTLAVGLCAGGVHSVKGKDFSQLLSGHPLLHAAFPPCASRFLAWAPTAQSIPKACRVIALSGEPVLGMWITTIKCGEDAGKEEAQCSSTPWPAQGDVQSHLIHPMRFLPSVFSLKETKFCPCFVYIRCNRIAPFTDSFPASGTPKLFLFILPWASLVLISLCWCFGNMLRLCHLWYCQMALWCTAMPRPLSRYFLPAACSLFLTLAVR